MSSGPRAIFRANMVLRAAEKWRNSYGMFTSKEDLDLAMAVDAYKEEVYQEHVNGPDIDKDEKKT